MYAYTLRLKVKIAVLMLILYNLCSPVLSPRSEELHVTSSSAVDRSAQTRSLTALSPCLFPTPVRRAAMDVTCAKLSLITPFQTILICLKKCNGWMDGCRHLAWLFILFSWMTGRSGRCGVKPGKDIPLVLKTQWLTLGGLASQSAQT